MFESVIRELSCFLTFENKKYLNVNQVNIDKNDINTIKLEIDELLRIYNSPYINSSKLYDVMIRRHSQLMDKIPFINSKFRMFSLAQYVLKDDYTFSRPFISTTNSKNISRETIMLEYANGLDRFNSEIINAYAKRMRIKLYSYNNFIIDMSDNFVQVGVDSMIKKDVLNLSEEDINKIKSITEYLIDINDGVINTENSSIVYPSLVEKNIKGNKYLLVGIIRTYLNDFFTIEQTSTQYNSTDYNIKKA